MMGCLLYAKKPVGGRTHIQEGPSLPLRKQRYIMGTYLLQLARSESSYIFLASVSIQVPLDDVLFQLMSDQYAIVFVLRG